MGNYIRISFKDINEDQLHLLVALLENIGFDGFEENENALTAYIKEEAFDAKRLEKIAKQCNASYTTSLEKEQNWNAVWESNFQPVIVNDFVAVRASFHEPVAGVAHEIIITPKMSFGTGHHATTWMMLEQMSKLDFTDKTVFDFGAGTGILAILAEKLGASVVIAIDNDEWSIRNAKENFSTNGCHRIILQHHDTAEMQQHFDIILANINKNIILTNLSFLVSQLNAGGFILLSGLLKDDEADILNELKKYPVTHVYTQHKDKWIAILLTA